MLPIGPAVEELEKEIPILDLTADSPKKKKKKGEKKGKNKREGPYSKEERKAKKKAEKKEFKKERLESLADMEKWEQPLELGMQVLYLAMLQPLQGQML